MKARELTKQNEDDVFPNPSQVSGDCDWFPSCEEHSVWPIAF